MVEMTEIGHMKLVDARIEGQSVSQRVIESDISGTTASDALSGWVSDPLRYTNPGVGSENVKTKTTLSVSLTAIFAALYAVGVVVLAPISFQVFQVRVADALLPLAIIFGWPAVLGLSLGAVVANFFGGLGIVDIVGGGIANFLATYFAWNIGQRRMKGSWAVAVITQIAVVTIIVGSYLSYLLQMPLVISLVGVLLGSVVAIGLLGYALLLALSRPRIVDQMKARGLIS
jgi:hypothetical protein